MAVMYGQTEATARMSTFFLDEYPCKIDSVGIAIPGGSFEIMDCNSDGEGDFGRIDEDGFLYVIGKKTICKSEWY